MTYGTDGTLKTLKEGRKTTRFSSYKRGVPQLVEYLWPTGAVYATEKSEINNLGNPDSTTDTEGNKTGYLYDAMGRLSKINYPSTTTVPEWASTTIKFSRAAAAKYGLPIGHWRYEVKTGNGYVINYYDALWRPVVSEQFDSANADATLRITKRMFDSGGRTIYESYPKRTYDALGDGTHYQFDALGRTEMIGKNSELETGMLYSGFTYKDDFVTEQVDYRGKPTLISYLTFDQPSQEMIVKVAAPLGVITEIKRDNFGKPLSVRRSDAKKSATRTYIYDAHERLCKTIEPETGGTVQAYDAYNTIAWKASGQSKDATCQTAILDAAKTTFGYDHMNRLLTTTFGDKSPAISRTYTRDGLFDTVSSGGSLWSFAYNNRRMLKSETVSYSNVRYPIGRNYDANGNLKSITYPSNTTPPFAVDYAPNALGEPTKAGTFATDITYHPNGAIKSFKYGNGITHTMSQNIRGLPERSSDSNILNDAYVYDENANVKAIADDQAKETTRTMEYDALDRLTSVLSPLWGTASYAYDSLDNITKSTITNGITARTSTHEYDATNRLKNIKSNVAAYTQALDYDTRGNVIKRGAQEFKFDLANRMFRATNRGTYQYDGFGRRISTVGTDGVNRISVYTQDDKLIYAAISGMDGIKYIFLHNHLIAEAGPGYTHYVHTDALGSPVAITNSTKAVVRRTRYEPYGATAKGDIPAIGFTGHVNAADIGLVYMQQRYYDPVAGRFVGVDPVTTDADSGRIFNRYAYANNNTYKYVDPDGRFGVLGALVGASIEAGLQIASEGRVSNWTAVGIAGAAGMVTGGLGGIIGKTAVSGTVTTGRAVAAAAAVGGAAGAISKVADASISGKSTSPREVAVAGALGAVGGSAGAKIGLSAIAKVENLAGRSGIAGHIGATTQAAIQQGGRIVEPSTSAGQTAGQHALDTASSYAEKKFNQ